MDLPAVFIITLAFVTAVSLWYRISPFFTLIGGAILFGLLSGLTPDATILGVVTGIGRMFSAFGIIILCGAVIAKLLQEQDQTHQIVSDISRVVRHPPALAGLSGYLLAVPITCSITAYVLLNPILDRLGKDAAKRNVLLYLAAVGSIVSSMLIYPTPVVIPLFSAFHGSVSPFLFDAIAIPFSLLLLFGIFLYFRWIRPEAFTDTLPELPEPAGSGRHFHWRAWAPFIVILGAIPVASFSLGLSHGNMIQVVMLAGAMTAVALAPADARSNGLAQGAKHGGLIIFDICGAGALGFVIEQSGFAEGALTHLTYIVPIVLVPFLFAALIETAQGSRVVTAVITAGVLAKTPVMDAIHPIPLILLVSGGACLVSYVTDPYFWLVHRTTGDDIGTVVKEYTLPVALAGIAIFVVAVALEYLVFR
jgi:GntP family gluconate:H+ symporter